MAYAKGARQRGVTIVESAQVLDVIVEQGRAVGVLVAHDGVKGQLRAGTVVLTTGMWSAEMGRKLGLRLALQAAEHYYFVTEAVPGLSR